MGSKDPGYAAIEEAAWSTARSSAPNAGGDESQGIVLLIKPAWQLWLPAIRNYVTRKQRAGGFSIN